MLIYTYIHKELKSLIDSGDHLSKKLHVSHGSLMPETLYLTSEGHIKLINPVLLYNEPNSYQNILTNYMEKGLLSPALMKGLRNKDVNVKHDPIKSDVFAVGLIILYAGSLFNTRELYNYQAKTFDYNVCFEILNELKDKYSCIFINILGEMLQESEQNRPDFQELQLLIENPQEMHRNIADNCRIISDNSLRISNISNRSPTHYSPQITNFKPVFVSPRQILYKESPMTIRMIYETPIKKQTDRSFYERSLENYKEISVGLKCLEDRIENAIDRSLKNRRIFEEVNDISK